ncbi:hypothetical protein [Nocardia iowensis]|uniref:Uncharacterized protein n=1 Tax=Nocardia iowensis TaxID=204891 RepID=A0ABX8RL02_NOCIO|nr:hypothetical protein [Nocardia iowensis]QXN90309.1 hypothetical protein KV110_33605 [Nocardia iowensis]
MKIVMELHCPDKHDSAETRHTPARPNRARLAGQPVEHYCPVCAPMTLEPGLTIVGGASTPTGYCPCCHATWLSGQPIELLAAGRLVGVEAAAGEEVRS